MKTASAIKDTERGLAITSALRADSISGVGKEFLELGIDSALAAGLLKDIPIVNTVIGIFSTARSATEYLLVTKLLRFLNELSEIPKEKRIEMVTRLNEDDKFSGKVGSSLIEILDRLESEKKPELAAKFFSAYAMEKISFDELRRVLFSLERIPSFDIEKLDNFSIATIEDSLAMDESTLLAFVNAGLGVNNGGLDGGAVIPTSLCKIFLRASS